MITALIIIIYIILGLIATKLIFKLFAYSYDPEDPEDTAVAVITSILWPILLTFMIVVFASKQLFKRIL